MTAPTANRYGIQAMQRARELREASWTLAQITDILRLELGRPGLSKNTVHNWVSPEQAEKSRLRSQRNNRVKWNAVVTGRLGLARHSTDLRLIRMRALHDLGVSFAAIATVINFDFGSDLTTFQVEYALRVGRYPTRSPRTVTASCKEAVQ